MTHNHDLDIPAFLVRKRAEEWSAVIALCIAALLVWYFADLLGTLAGRF